MKIVTDVHCKRKSGRRDHKCQWQQCFHCNNDYDDDDDDDDDGCDYDCAYDCDYDCDYYDCDYGCDYNDCDYVNITIMNTTAIDIRCHNGTVFASNHCENSIAELFKYL